MTTGTKKASDILLKCAIAICILYALMHLLEFVASHVPPFKAGQCLSTPNPFINLKVNENHILQGYADVDIQLLGKTVKSGPVDFDSLGNPAFKEMECPNE